MTLAAAVTRINTWAYTGLVTNLGDGYNTAPFDSALPALALDFSDGGKGFENVDFTAASGIVKIPLMHLLIVSSIGSYTPAKRQLVPGYIDSYLAEARADLTLNAALAKPLEIASVVIGASTFYGQHFYVVQFNHVWAVAV